MNEPDKIVIRKEPERSDWKCHLFGADPTTGDGFVLTPAKEDVPNWFIRYTMKVLLGCTWVKK